jgi:hypothetical protein
MNQPNKEPEIIIKNADDFEKVLKDRKSNAKQHIMNQEAIEKDQPVFDHVKCANQAIKVIGILPIDDIIKTIMVRRLAHPLIAQCEITHLSLALELGLREYQVKEMEEFGIIVLEEFLNKHTAHDAVAKFNTNQTVEKAVKQIIG